MSQIEYVDHLDTTALSEQNSQLGLGAVIAAVMAKWHGRRDAVSAPPADVLDDARTRRHQARERHFMNDIGMAADF